MVDGVYDVTVRIPFNSVSGEVVLVSSGGTVKVTVRGGGFEESAVGTCDGDEFSFKGEIPTPLGTMGYTLDGRVKGDDITADCVTKMGTFKASGRRRG